MIKYDILIYCIKIFFINIYTYYISQKLLGNKKTNSKNLFILTLGSIVLAVLCTIIKDNINSILAICILYFIYSIFIKLLMHKKIGYSMLLIVISLSISLLALGISIALEFLLYKIFKIDNNFINLVFILLMQGILIWGFFKIKRFSKGFEFLKNKNEYIDIIIINISTIIIYVYCLLGNYYHKTATNMFIMFIFLGIFMIIMIQEAFIKYYKQNLLKKTIEEYKKEIKDKEEIINKLSEEKFSISKLNHEFYNRQKALELKVKEMTLEAGEEIGVLDRIDTLTNEYSENLQKIKGKSKLPLTDISEIDDMFKYMQTECYNNKIDFKLQVEENIYQLVNNIIPKNKLETLIGDHIRDAIIAVNSSDNKYKSILVILGIKDNCYELCIYDSGIEFEIETLLKLGLESITTHKEDGGTGIGFVTTFETLKECKASLIIQERHKEIDNDYTKALIFRFDNNNEYKIYSYRADEIRKYSNDDRIIIENLEVE